MNRIVKIAGQTVLFGGIFFVGVVVGVSPSPEDSEPEVTTKTVTKTIEVPVTETVTKTVEVPVVVTATPEPVVSKSDGPVPQSCLTAMQNAQDIQTAVSHVSGTMGEQLDIASKARVAMVGADYLDLGHVQRDQRELEESMRGYYTDLAGLYSTLKQNNELCKQELN